MAISSAIVKFQPDHLEQITQSLTAFPSVSIEAKAPNGDLIIVIEEENLKDMESTCVKISKLPGILSLNPSYITTADEADEETAQ